MVIEWTLLSLGAIVLVEGDYMARKVYMDRYGDCVRDGPFEVDRDKINIYAQGGEPYDTLVCELVFKSAHNDRLCVSFNSLNITSCDVRLSLFAEQSSQGHAIASYDGCHLSRVVPDTLCGKGRYITITMTKTRLSHDGYNFSLELREYTQGEALADSVDAYIVNISTVIGIIVAVIVVLVLVAALIVYCYCKTQRFGLSQGQKYGSSVQNGEIDVPVIEPTAPPLLDYEPPAYCENPPPYTDSNVVHAVQTHYTQS